MGCVVNGPGEARKADFGIAGGEGEGVVFAQGQAGAQGDAKRSWSMHCSRR